ncbi:reverse gyrase [Plantibacter sp. PA-3-X8]|uniref:ApeA N-terminal domain 1-containing protein n=1 Tax=Plantibacter sp. PA-3-X8 TaxID=2480625 RepID=UPI000F5ED91C|nr:HEPN domain-containing protein [Plantibacter sp. PA-3-X8]AZH81681.1 reverse gyrase [Plantibacter sp. PA-3-X8]
MPNKLPMGTRRTGDLYDSYEDTPDVKVTLERSEQGLSVTVAWSSPEVPYAAWFMSRGGFLPGTEPKEPKPVPQRVVFHDSHGSVLLIRCWARGFHADAFGPGSGTLWARAAILGVEADLQYDRPHGLSSEISGLREWLGVTSWSIEHELVDGVGVARLTSVPPARIELGDHSGLVLELTSGWQVVPDEGGDRRELLDLLWCTTRSSEPMAWDEHLQLHKALRDLLVLSRWRNESCVVVHAFRQDDPLVTLDGATHGEQWREVIVPGDERVPPPSGWHPHLLRFEDLGVAGINHWINLRDHFARALDPVISSMDLRNATPHTRLAHTGPGLEALGYLLVLRDGATEQKASRMPLRARFERILSEVGDCLPFDGSTWVEDAVSRYNGLKHANRAQPDEVDLLNTWADSVMVVRTWVALELGIPKAEVTKRLVDDRQPRGFSVRN